MTILVRGEMDASAAIRLLSRLMDAPLEQMASSGAAAADQLPEEEALREKTPVDTGRLKGSTGSALAPGSTSTGVLLIQDAEVRPNEDGSGGGYPYWIYEVKGHGSVSAPAPDFGQGTLWPSHTTGKGAFYGKEKGFGPRRHIRAVEGYDYPHIAMEESAPARAAHALGAAVESVMTVMKVAA